MTAVETTLAPVPAVLAGSDHRGSWLPGWRMVTTRNMELRKRRGLMVALTAVCIGLPTLFLVIRLIAHAAAPHSYGPAGGYDIFTNLSAGVLYIFGFIMAALLGCTAGSIDLTEGMFRHLVITGRSRLALYLARIPAGLGIIMPLVAVGFAIVCTVCVFAAPTTISYQGGSVPAGLSQAGLERWAGTHVDEVLCNFDYQAPTPPNVPCGPGGPVIKGPGPGPGAATGPSPAALKAMAESVARDNYAQYRQIFLSPPLNVMVRTGLWIELEVAIGFLVGLGLSSLIGQRTVSLILMVVLELILTPIALRANLPHLLNLQRSIVGVATAHLEPAGLPVPFGGGGPQDAASLVHETHLVAVLVVLAWMVVWTALGAWRMVTRDA